MTIEETISELKEMCRWYQMLDEEKEIINVAIRSLEAWENVREQIPHVVDKIPITFSRQNADSCLKQDLLELIDKAIGEVVENED